MKAIKGILSVILSFLIFIFSFACIATAALKFKVANVDYYVDEVVTDEYVVALRNDVDNNLKIICENLEIDSETIMAFVDNSELKRVSQNNLRITYSTLMSGTPLEYERLENSDLKAEIYKELEAFANEMGIVDEDISQATELTYEYVMDDINATLTYFTQDNMNVVSFVAGIPGLLFVIGDAFYAVIAALVVLCVLKFLVMGKKRALSFAYNSSFMIWLASACWFIPVTVFKLQDVTTNIAIAHSGFKVYLRNIINSVIDGFFDVSLVAIIISTVLSIGSIVIVLVSGVKKQNKSAQVATESVDEVVAPIEKPMDLTEEN